MQSALLALLILAYSLHKVGSKWKGDLEAISFFGLKKTPWHSEDEVPYPDAQYVLEQLTGRGYKIGVIANQNSGTAQQLEQYGLLKYIDLVVASAEEGVAKPDKEIFRRALERADCLAQNAVMIGDRLDNDIFPVKALGMKTVRITQGLGAYQTPENSLYQADFTVNSLTGLLNIF